MVNPRLHPSLQGKQIISVQQGQKYSFQLIHDGSGHGLYVVNFYTLAFYGVFSFLHGYTKNILLDHGGVGVVGG